jgi:hypothetical protein
MRGMKHRRGSGPPVLLKVFACRLDIARKDLCDNSWFECVRRSVAARISGSLPCKRTANICLHTWPLA